MIDKQIHQKILILYSESKSDRKIASELGIDRTTVKKYKNIPLEQNIATFRTVADIDVLVKHWYAYVIGLYLGDGCISKFARTSRLRLYFHSHNNEDIINRATLSLNKIFPKNNISRYNQLHVNCSVVGVYNKNLPDLFPQHGTGKKHSRDVSLKPSQLDLMTDAYARFILAGLHDSDGCMYHEQLRRRFVFTNTSPDIIDIYKKVLEMYAIEFTESVLAKPLPHHDIHRIFIRKATSVTKYADLLNTCYIDLTNNIG